MTFHEALMNVFGGEKKALDERIGWKILIKNDLSIYDYTDFLNVLPDSTKEDYALEILGMISDYQEQTTTTKTPTRQIIYDLETLRRLEHFLQRAEEAQGDIGGRDVFEMRAFFDTITSDLEIIKSKDKTNTQLIIPTLYYKGDYTKNDIKVRILNFRT